MKALRSLLLSIMSIILSLILVIVLYANVPVFHDLLYDAVNDYVSSVASVEQDESNEAATVLEVASLDQEVTLNNSVEKQSPVVLDNNTIPVSKGDKASIGDIVQIGDLYTCLVYAKRMDVYPSGLGDKEVTEGNEVLLFFFDIYNSGAKRDHLGQKLFDGYADGEKVSETGTFIGIVVDGICRADLAYIVDPGTKAMDIVEFEVPKGWSSFELFYESDGHDASWKISINQTSTEPYEFKEAIEVDVSRSITNVGDVIYDGEDYRLTYLGHESESSEDLLFVTHPVYYEYFMFKIENKMDRKLKLGTIGYGPTAYADNYAMSYSVDFVERRGNYHNILDVHDLEVGMSVDVFVSFSKAILNPDSNTYYLIFPVTEDNIDGPKVEVYIDKTE